MTAASRQTICHKNSPNPEITDESASGAGVGKIYFMLPKHCKKLLEM
ncbi:MAG: hypothetical protein GXP26_17345 [Planctomycetes bacterium]|nr:hypothetical protein [Planctomycetota bacterium]